MFIHYSAFDIKLLHYTPLDVAIEAALTCTSTDNKLEEYKLKKEEFLLKLLKSGHESVFEHLTYTFKIKNISRALLQELARHRHISLSVMSTRYALKKELSNNNTSLTFKLPNFSANNQQQVEAYNNLLNVLTKAEEAVINAVDAGIKNDVLKYFIPESLVTKLVLTVNCRELRHIFNLRLSNRALEEFRHLCLNIYNVIPDDHKFLYSDIINNYGSDLL